MTYNNLQNTIQEANDCTTQTPIKSGGEIGLSKWVSSRCSTGGTRKLYLFPIF